MNESRHQKRERAMEQMRTQKTEHWKTNQELPAIHPRYRSAYGKLYQEEQPTQEHTFFFRVLISLILFAGILNWNQLDLPIVTWKQSDIIHQIETSWTLPSRKEFDLSHIL